MLEEAVQDQFLASDIVRQWLSIQQSDSQAMQTKRSECRNQLTSKNPRTNKREEQRMDRKSKKIAEALQQRLGVTAMSSGQYEELAESFIQILLRSGVQPIQALLELQKPPPLNRVVLVVVCLNIQQQCQLKIKKRSSNCASSSSNHHHHCYINKGVVLLCLKIRQQRQIQIKK